MRAAGRFKCDLTRPRRGFPNAKQNGLSRADCA